MKIAVIGAGKVGSALGSGWAEVRSHYRIWCARSCESRVKSTINDHLSSQITERFHRIFGKGPR